MDKGFMVFIAIGIGFLYFVTTFVGGLQEKDTLKSNEYIHKHQYDAYQRADSIGREILDVTGAEASVQLSAWNSSPLKEDFLMLFPAFSDMKVFAKERIRGKFLKDKLLNTIQIAEDQYFTGTLKAEGAKRMLSTLK